MMKNKNKIFIWILSIFAVSFMALFGYRNWMLARLEDDHLHMPPNLWVEPLEIPQRPGIGGIIITGPELRQLKFEINTYVPGRRSIDWSYLTEIAPSAAIRIEAEILQDGRLKINQDDVKMAGFPQAGLYVIQAMNTWVYEPTKRGKIGFWFNLASRGQIKLTIDISRLEDNPDYYGQKVKIGTLYDINNMPSGSVNIGSLPR